MNRSCLHITSHAPVLVPIIRTRVRVRAHSPETARRLALSPCMPFRLVSFYLSGLVLHSPYPRRSNNIGL